MLDFCIENHSSTKAAEKWPHPTANTKACQYIPVYLQIKVSLVCVCLEVHVMIEMGVKVYCGEIDSCLLTTFGTHTLK